jgi:hypothetical protein
MQLKPEESSALGLIVQFSRVKRAKPDLQAMLERLGPDAKKVGKILLGENPASFSKTVRETARAFQSWHKANVRIGNRRSQRTPATARRSTRLGSSSSATGSSRLTNLGI